MPRTILCSRIREEIKTDNWQKHGVGAACRIYFPVDPLEPTRSIHVFARQASKADGEVWLLRSSNFEVIQEFDHCPTVTDILGFMDVACAAESARTGVFYSRA